MTAITLRNVGKDKYGQVVNDFFLGFSQIQIYRVSQKLSALFKCVVASVWLYIFCFGTTFLSGIVFELSPFRQSAYLNAFFMFE